MAALLAVLACGQPAPGGDPATRTEDSAGVRVVRNGAPKWGPGEGWTISDRPVLRLGVVDGAREYLFHDIADIMRLSDGTIVVLNAGDGQVRYYSSDGRHLRTVSGEGNGPGEMRAGR